MDLRLTNLTRGDATLLSGQAGRSREGGERQNQTRSDHWSTAICRVSSPPLREPTGSVGRRRPWSRVTVSDMQSDVCGGAAASSPRSEAEGRSIPEEEHRPPHPRPNNLFPW